MMEPSIENARHRCGRSMMLTLQYLVVQVYQASKVLTRRRRQQPTSCTTDFYDALHCTRVYVHTVRHYRRGLAHTGQVVLLSLGCTWYVQLWQGHDPEVGTAALYGGGAPPLPEL